MFPFSVNGYDFNLDAMTSFEGDTGPYLQYAHARLCSMTRKSELDVNELVNANFDLLTEQHAVDLVRLLAQWPDVLLQTAKTLEPITVLSYLFRMTHMLSSSYDVLKVIGSEPDVKQARMALYASARQVLNNGMRVLGLSPVQRLVFPILVEEAITNSSVLVCKFGLFARFYSLFCVVCSVVSISQRLVSSVYLDFNLVALGSKSGTNKNGICFFFYRDHSQVSPFFFFFSFLNAAFLRKNGDDPRRGRGLDPVHASTTHAPHIAKALLFCGISSKGFYLGS